MRVARRGDVIRETAWHTRQLASRAAGGRQASANAMPAAAPARLTPPPFYRPKHAKPNFTLSTTRKQRCATSTLASNLVGSATSDRHRDLVAPPEREGPGRIVEPPDRRADRLEGSVLQCIQQLSGAGRRGRGDRRLLSWRSPPEHRDRRLARLPTGCLTLVPGIPVPHPAKPPWWRPGSRMTLRLRTSDLICSPRPVIPLGWGPRRLCAV